MAAFIAVSVVMSAAAAAPMALLDFGGLPQLRGREHRREPLCFAAAPRAARGNPSSRRGYDSEMAGEIRVISDRRPVVLYFPAPARARPPSTSMATGCRLPGRSRPLVACCLLRGWPELQRSPYRSVA